MREADGVRRSGTTWFFGFSMLASLAGACGEAGPESPGAYSVASRTVLELGSSGARAASATPMTSTGGSHAGGTGGISPASGAYFEADAVGTDITAVCLGGTVGKDSDNAKAQPLTVSREHGAVKYLTAAGNPILSLKTTLLVPKVPTSRQTLFVWPGMQNRGGRDPTRILNGILQPVLTWGPSCAPKAPKDGYSAWWMAAMYVNVSSNAAGPTGCAGGDFMMTEVGDQLLIDMSVTDTKWTQTITNLRTMMAVDLTTDLEGQVQNWATWAVEVPSGETVKPSEDVIFTQSVLTFTSPVTTCQPSQAGGSDYYSAPVLSTDGLHCCYDRIILRAQRT